MEIVDHERVADELDRAAHIAEMHNQNCVQEIMRAARPEQVCTDGVWETETCRTCDEDIEPVRLRMGKVLCYACQSLLEKRRQRGL